VRAAYREAAAAAFQGGGALTVWEQRLIARQASVRRLYLSQAALLKRSPEAADRAVGVSVEAWVRGMPAPASRRLELSRELRSASRALKAREPPIEPQTPGPERRR
jgi:hypothetical protein